MSSIRHLVLAALLLVLGLNTTDSLAQRGPGRGGERHRNDSLDVRKDGLRHPKRDSVRQGRPQQRGRGHEMIGYFMQNDSCRQVLLSRMSAEDAATFDSILSVQRVSIAKIREDRQLLRAAHESRDTAAFRRISEELHLLYRQTGDIHKSIADLIGKYASIAMTVRKECGGLPPRGEDGKDRDRDRGHKGEQQGAVIAPNPAPLGGSAILTLTLAEDATVSVTVSDQSGVVLTIPQAQYTAGVNQITLDLANLARGVYLVKVQSGDKVQVVKLMIG